MSTNHYEDSPASEVLAHVVDVHCHPTDSVVVASVMDSLPIKICAMATKKSDQPQHFFGGDTSILISSPVNEGFHPWFTHWIALEPPTSKEQHYKTLLLPNLHPDNNLIKAFERLLPNLPEPALLSDVLTSLRINLTDFPHAMLGEVGLDRSFRIPWSPDPNIPRILSEFTVPLEHQLHILEAQLRLAVELKRNVSFHSVKAQQATLQLVDRMSKQYGDDWDMISLDMHSCGLSPEMWIILEKRHPNVYLSLSTTINARSPSHRALISACDPCRLLAESDYHDIRGSTERTWEMISTIADVKGWHIETKWDPALTKEHWGTVRRLEENWNVFSRGEHLDKRRQLNAKKRNKKDRQDKYWDMDGDSTQTDSIQEGGI